MKREFLQFSIEDLESLYEENSQDYSVIETLNHELMYRRTSRANILRRRVAQTQTKLKSVNKGRLVQVTYAIKNGNFTLAEQLLLKVFKSSPQKSHPCLSLDLAQVQRKLGKHRKALKNYYIALQTLPDNETALRGLLSSATITNMKKDKLFALRRLYRNRYASVEERIQLIEALPKEGSSKLLCPMVFNLNKNNNDLEELTDSQLEHLACAFYGKSLMKEVEEICKQLLTRNKDNIVAKALY